MGHYLVAVHDLVVDYHVLLQILQESNKVLASGFGDVQVSERILDFGNLFVEKVEDEGAVYEPLVVLAAIREQADLLSST